MTIADGMTWYRMASAPLFLAVFLNSAPGRLIPQHVGLVVCLVIACASELSDILDGYFARRSKVSSDFGKLLDPYADSIFRLSCFFSFASQAHGKWMPIWMPMILFYRDLINVIVRAYGLQKGHIVAARASGKIKAIVQGTVIITVLALAVIHGAEDVAYSAPPGSGITPTAVAHDLMWVVTLVTIWSAWDYVWGNRHLFANSGGDKPAPSA